MESNDSFIMLATFEAPYSVQLCAFGLFLPLFVVTIVANVAVLATVAARVDLHKPMYMFLCSLVVADLISSVSTMPKQLQMLLTGDNRILRTACMAQMFWINVFVIMQVLTLAAMAFDRYVAICFPLHYHTIVTGKRAIIIIFSLWSLTISAFVPVTILFAPLKLKDSDRQMQGILCDNIGFARVSAGDTRIHEAYGSGIIVVLIALPLSVISFTYFRILLECKRTHSNDFKNKALYTLFTHFLLLMLFFIPLFLSVLVPRLVKDFYSAQVRNIRCSAQYTSFLMPLSNVTIYFFRTKELRKEAVNWFHKIIPRALSNSKLKKVSVRVE
ncbi:olfactory receptor 1496-like [Petromyzon marinus]|uniref:Olfactory receptor 1496-like n=1 Tax=Petromyzon marinus TaxID=7757 RepID=A0AAJ7UA99_PETMA|nr:olfactory receptor 1496-like [Petromyzon marinus]AZL87791.1 odorant receptor [Petromyzon marinus]